MKNTQKAKKCCKKGCPNSPLKGRKTCGRHPRKASGDSRKKFTIHYDRVLKTLEQDQPEQDQAVVVSRIPVETPYSANIAVRDNGAILGLPTNLSGLKTLLSDWLLRPGRSLYEIDALTPAHLPARDRDLAIVDIAARLVRYDLGLGVLA